MDDDALWQIDRHILATIFLSDESYRNLAYLCDEIGHRYAGSANEKAAAAYLKQKMQEYGLENVHLEEFPIPGWERGACHMRLTAPVVREISAIALPFCCAADIDA